MQKLISFVPLWFCRSGSWRLAVCSRSGRSLVLSFSVARGVPGLFLHKLCTVAPKNVWSFLWHSWGQTIWRRGYFGKASISEMNMKIRIQPWAYKGCKGTQMCISCVLYYTYIQKQSKTCIIIYKYTCHIYMIYWICLYIHSECCDRTIRRDLSNSAIHKKRVEIITFTQNVMQLQRRAEAALKSSKRMPQKCPQIDIGPHVGPGEFIFFSMVLWMFAVDQLWKINDFERKILKPCMLLKCCCNCLL